MTPTYANSLAGTGMERHQAAPVAALRLYPAPDFQVAGGRTPRMGFECRSSKCFGLGGLLLLRHAETLLGVLDPLKCLLAYVTDLSECC